MEAHPTLNHCPSCGAARVGPYCASCGERYPQAVDLELRSFLFSHLWREFFEIDGKVLRTLGLLVSRPGQLAVEFVNGRRKPFVSPLRLYLVLFLIQASFTALMVGHGQSVPDSVNAIDSTGVLHRLLAHRSDVAWNDLELRVKLTERAHWFSEIASLVTFIGVAAIQGLVFWPRRRRFVEHLALALTVTSFLLVALIGIGCVVVLVVPARFAEITTSVQQILAFSALPLYWGFAIHRFYGTGPLASAGLAVVMALAQAVTATVLYTLMLALLIVTA